MTFIPTPTKLVATDATLVAVEPIDPRAIKNEKRALLVPPSIAELFKNNKLLDQNPTPKIAATVQTYIMGGFVSVSLTGDNSQSPIFERYTGQNEVWGMCFRQPKQSQWRLIGRFLQRNVFVGLSLYQRGEMAPDAVYEQIVKDFPAFWEEVFPNGHFLQGTKIDDYLTEPFRNCDEPLL